MKSVNVDLPILIGQAGPLNGNRWEIVKELLIGREDTCAVVIPDRQVSRYHARLTITPDGVALEDLASKNGTYRNGTLVEEPVFLQDGDLIQVAAIQHFVFLSSDSTVPLGPGVPIPEPLQSAATQNNRLILDPLSRRVWVDGSEVNPALSVPQFRLLEALYNSRGRVVSRQDLVGAVWGDEESAGVSEQALDALVRRLRDRLASLDRTHEYLLTVRGYGLRLDNPPQG
ncbi:MAG TPA: FHA domain-containing protein [Bellilinea sp.]